MNNDMISRKALRKDIEHLNSVYAKNKEWFYTDVLDHIDNAPTVDTDLSKYSDKLWKEAYERGHKRGYKEGYEQAILDGKTNFSSFSRQEGEWIKKIDLVNSVSYICSECGFELELEDCSDSYYCVNCGAKMKEADNDK